MGDVIRINLDDDEKKTSRPKKAKKEPEKYESGLIESVDDLEKLVGDFESNINAQSKYIDYLRSGVGFDQALDAVDKVINAVSGGPQNEFYINYLYMTDPAKMDAFLKMDDGPVDYSTKRQITIFFKLVDKASHFRADFVRLLNDRVQERFVMPYCAIRYKFKTEELYTSYDHDALVQAFKEFDRICRVYQGNTYDYFNIQEMTVGLEDARDQILKLMDNDIKGCPALREILSGATTLNPYARNLFSVYDKTSAEFHEYWDFKGEMEETIREVIKLENDLAELYKTNGTYENRWNGYYDCMRDFLFSLQLFYRDALNVIEDFLEKEHEAPYSIIHSDSYIKNCISQNKLAPLGDTRREGTNYVEVFQSMPRRLKEIAMEIAKTMLR